MADIDFESQVKSRLFGKKVYYYAVTDSTNIRSLELIKRGEEEGVIVIADEQTAGRGRRGRVWHSERGKNLLFSLIIKPDKGEKITGILSLTAAVSIADAVKNLYGLIVECKWPNDLLLNGKKFCGILSEAVWIDGKCNGISLGVGINVNQKKFNKEIEQNSTSIAMILGRQIDRCELLAEVLKQLEYSVIRLKESYSRDIIDRWLKLSPQIGKQLSIDVDGKIYSGIAEDVSEDGALIVRNGNNIMKIHAGDVSYDTRIGCR